MHREGRRHLDLKPVSRLCRGLRRASFPQRAQPLTLCSAEPRARNTRHRRSTEILRATNAPGAQARTPATRADRTRQARLGTHKADSHRLVGRRTRFAPRETFAKGKSRRHRKSPRLPNSRTPSSSRNRGGGPTCVVELSAMPSRQTLRMIATMPPGTKLYCYIYAHVYRIW